MLPFEATQHSAHSEFLSSRHSQASSPTLMSSPFLSISLMELYIVAFSIPQDGEYLKAMLMSLRLNEADVLR
jgi:hypothetical protein